MATKLTKYKGVRTKQSSDIFFTVPTLLEQAKPARIMEIGTFAGGFSLFVTLRAPEAEYVGYEIDRGCLHESVGHLNIKVMDFFEDLDFIEQYVQGEGTTIVFCDGGNKTLEFAMIAPMLKPGDIILTHDYLDDTKHDNRVYQSVEGFKKPETFKSQLLPIANRYGLYDDVGIDFTMSLWSCWIKEES